MAAPRVWPAPRICTLPLLRQSRHCPCPTKYRAPAEARCQQFLPARTGGREPRVAVGVGPRPAMVWSLTMAGLARRLANIVPSVFRPRGVPRLRGVTGVRCAGGGTRWGQAGVIVGALSRAWERRKCATLRVATGEVPRDGAAVRRLGQTHLEGPICAPWSSPDWPLDCSIGCLAGICSMDAIKSLNARTDELSGPVGFSPPEERRWIVCAC